MILLGSIDLSVEGVLTLSAVLVCLLVRNGANGNDFGLFGVAVVLGVGALVGLVNGLVHVRLRIPSFMVTLGMWFVGVGTANALLGGLAVRINDPMIRGLAIGRVLGLPWGVWLAARRAAVAWVIQNYTRLGRHIYALGGGEELAALVGHFDRPGAAADLHAGRRLLRARRRPRGRATRPRQRPDRPGAAVHHRDGRRGGRHVAVGRRRRRAADRWSAC